MMLTSVLVLTTLLNCSSQRDDQDGKTRIEQVQNLPFRSLSVPSKLKDEINIQCLKFWDELGGIVADKPRLVTVKGDDFNSLELKSETPSAIRLESYDLWRKRDFEYTALMYKSSVQDVESGKSKDIYVIEVEHNKLTGTYYIFLPKKKSNLDEAEFNYVDRN